MMFRKQRWPGTRFIINSEKKRSVILPVCLLWAGLFLLSTNASALNDTLQSEQIRFAGSGEDSARAVVGTSDGGFLVSALTTSIDGDAGGLGTLSSVGSVVIKYDSSNKVLWRKLYDTYYIRDLAVLPDGFIAVGDNYLKQDGVILKLNSSGEIQWKKEMGGTMSDSLNAVALGEDGSIIAVGNSSSKDNDLAGMNKGEADAWIVQISSSGNLMWARTFGGSVQDSFLDVTFLRDGNIMVVGNSFSVNGDLPVGLVHDTGHSNAIAVKYSKSGILLSKNTFGGTSYETFNTISGTMDGGFIAAGRSSSSDGDLSGYPLNSFNGALLVKYNIYGNREWVRLLGGVGHSDEFYSIVQTPDGKYATAGRSDSNEGPFLGLNKGNNDGMMAEFDAQGQLLRLDLIGSQGHDYFYAGALLFSGTKYIAVGDTQYRLDGTYLKKKTDAVIQVYDLNARSEAIPEFSVDNPELTNKDVEVTIKYPLEANVKQYKLGSDGVWQTYLTSVRISENTLLWARFMNSKGVQSKEYSFDINNIDKIPPSIPTIIADITAPTNGNVTVTISYPRDTKKEYRIDGGAWITYMGPVVLTNNVKLEAKATDKVGNSSTERMDVENIDRIAPERPVFVPNTTITTNNSVKLSVIYPEDGGSFNEYKIGSGDWHTYDFYTHIELDSNTIIYARTRDQAGNTSESNFEINYIDKIPPTTPTISLDYMMPTNKDVKATIEYSEDSIIREYTTTKLNYDWKSYTNPVIVDSNTEVYARSRDAAGNYSEIKSVQITNIDKTPPTLPTFSIDLSKISENKKMVVINYSNDSEKKEYRVNGGDWLNYNSAVIFSENGTLEARAVDTLGNISSPSSIDVAVGPDKAIINSNNMQQTNQNILITVRYAESSVKKEYRINKEDWNIYTGSIELTFNGTIEARSTDNMGYWSVSSYRIDNIDKVPPIKPVISASPHVPTINNVVVSIDYPQDAETKEYRKNSGRWTTYTNNIIFSDNGTVEARAKDAAGNYSPVSSFTVNNIDRVAPQTPSIISISDNKLTNKYVIISVAYPADTYSKQYRINNGSWKTKTNKGDIEYFDFEENGKLEIRSVKESGIASDIISYTVTNIDKTPPSGSILFNADNPKYYVARHVSVAYSNEAEKVTMKYQIGSTTGLWLDYKTPVELPANKKLYVYATDEAGNVGFVWEFGKENSSATYFYEKGRLKFIELDSGEKYEYNYDNNGNLQKITKVSSF
ncbi:hypothetical protein F4V43_02775 [Paenibacillus spiritus]|uniref:PQQ-binding-like beta-propeller repeat protein n=1 Tax=Paenibacillus spiritus TaxID=2496557 RepID=A0A5J5GIC3_9BACL|nr:MULTISPECIES: hypothetical protein [Paenibacillus]KAA9007428.1 hypothetical protein F4V43_02775 [Paenibacillus spiritus]